MTNPSPIPAAEPRPFDTQLRVNVAHLDPSRVINSSDLVLLGISQSSRPDHLGRLHIGHGSRFISPPLAAGEEFLAVAQLRESQFRKETSRQTALRLVEDQLSTSAGAHLAEKLDFIVRRLELYLVNQQSPTASSESIECYSALKSRLESLPSFIHLPAYSHCYFAVEDRLQDLSELCGERDKTAKYLGNRIIACTKWSSLQDLASSVVETLDDMLGYSKEIAKNFDAIESALRSIIADREALADLSLITGTNHGYTRQFSKFATGAALTYDDKRFIISTILADTIALEMIDEVTFSERRAALQERGSIPAVGFVSSENVFQFIALFPPEVQELVARFKNNIVTL